MNSKLSADPIKIANSSGFPLQLAVMNAINQSKNWEVMFDEHPWKNEISDSEGFIDIVATNINKVPLMSLIIECKRVKQTGWVFLVKMAEESETLGESKFKIWDSRWENGGWQSFGWKEEYLQPGTYVSQYCAIQGKSDDGRLSIIEKTAAHLVDSVEAFAIEEKTFVNHREPPARNFNKIYVPIIVTTAKLFVIHIDSDIVSIQDGDISKNAACIPVDYIRFKKALNTKRVSSSVNIEFNHIDNQHTVFVVNSAKFSNFLSETKTTFEYYVQANNV